MDALTHAVEAYIGNSTTPGTRKDALMATELIFNNLDRAYTNGSDTTARKNGEVAMMFVNFLKLLIMPDVHSLNHM